MMEPTGKFITSVSDELNSSKHESWMVDCGWEKVEAHEFPSDKGVGMYFVAINRPPGENVTCIVFVPFELIGECNESLAWLVAEIAKEELSKVPL